MINNTLLENLKITDNPRMVLISILNNSKVPMPLKIMGFSLINASSDVDVAKLKDMFLKVMGYIETKDTEGLHNYLNAVGINSEIVKAVMLYATNSDKNQ